MPGVSFCGRICKKCGKEEYCFTGPMPGLRYEKEFRDAEAIWREVGKPVKMAGGCSAEKSPSCGMGDEHVGNYHTHPNGSRLNDWDRVVVRRRGQDEYVGRDRFWRDSVDHYDPATNVTNNLTTYP